MRLRIPPVSIDIGSYSVKVAQIHEGRSGVRAIRFAEQPLPPGFRWEIGGDRRPLIEAIRQALAKAGIRRRAAVLAIPRRQVTARISAYPAADRAALRRVIEYDLADQIPFPIDQVTLDFQPLGPSREQPGLTDVLVIAAQRDLVREYLALARDLGMSLAALTVDALALHDLLGIAGQPSTGVALTIEIGGRASTINLSENGRLRLTRSVGLGGQQLTLAIRDDLGVSQDEAQHLKRTEGLALLDRQPRPHRIHAWLDNLRGELRRSALSSGPAAVSQILLVGAGAGIPGLAEAIQSEFGTAPVALSAASLFPHAVLRGQSPEIADHCLLAIGEALRATSRTAWTISLVPREVAEVTRTRRLRVAAVALAVVVLGGLVAAYLVQARSASDLTERVKLLQAEAKKMDKRQEEAKLVIEQRDSLKKDLDSLQAAEARRFATLELLRSISQYAPTGVILTHFTVRPGQPLQIQGTATSSGAVADLQAGIASSHLVTSVSLDRADESAAPRPVAASLPPLPANRNDQGGRSNRSRLRAAQPRQTPTTPTLPLAAVQPPPARVVSFALTVHLWDEEQTIRPLKMAAGVGR